MAWHRSNQVSKRVDELPGVGPALATAPVASVTDPKAFRSGRDFSAWIGLVLAVADLRSAKSLFTKVQSWFSSTHILDHNESVPNEPHRYTLRLRPCCGFPVGVTVALSCLR